MGRRSAENTKSARGVNQTLLPVIAGINKAVGFALEVAMVAAFLFWGFGQESPWNLVLGIGIPAVTVVLWGAYLAPRSERFLGENIAQWVSLGLFLGAAAALLGAGLAVPGILLVVLSLGHVAAGRWLKTASAA